MINGVNIYAELKELNVDYTFYLILRKLAFP